MTEQDERSSKQKHTQKIVRLGLVADNSLELGKLVSLIRDTQYQIVCSVMVSKNTPLLPKEVDAWVVRINDHCDAVDHVLDTLEESDVPIIVQDASAEISTVETLASKILEATEDSEHKRTPSKRPTQVWVCGASTGGPEAVSQFVSMLDKRTESAAFVYVQHIDTPVLPALIAGVQARTSLKVGMCEHGAFIEAGKIYVVSPDQAFDLDSTGKISMLGTGWKGPYLPSINQVMAKVTRCYRDRSGAVIFTGMGDDGSESAQLMTALGGKVLVQSYDSCTVDSMPRCAGGATKVFFTGSVEQLASKINVLCGENQK